MPSAGSLRKWVTLDDPVEDGTPVVFSPERVPVAMRPDAPASFGERVQGHIVEMRYHPQVTFNTRLKYRDVRRGIDRVLYVKGLQNVDERDEWLILRCEEVLTP